MYVSLEPVYLIVLGQRDAIGGSRGQEYFWIVTADVRTMKGLILE